MEIQVIDARTKNKLCVLERVSGNTTIQVLKELFAKKHPKYSPSRQSFRLEPRGKSLHDGDTLSKLNVGSDAILYFKDLGPQLGWSTVFFCEYSGPLFVYLLFYFRLPLIYGQEFAFSTSKYQVVHLAAVCHSIHYVKRLIETKFVHRFSHGTMPMRNLFKNCAYYWTFAGLIAYYTNHPLYTPPSYGDFQVNLGLGIFVFCELGNLSIHLALKNLRPAGSKERKIPLPTSNPFTWLFSLVSCPNYTYEVCSWLGFAIMTQTMFGLLFALVGFAQMSIWALGKHRNYKREFPKYPRGRKAIIPFFL